MPSSGSGEMPDRPSLPPVQEDALLASSWNRWIERDRQHQLRQAVRAQDDDAADQPGDRAADDAGQRHQQTDR